MAMSKGGKGKKTCVYGTEADVSKLVGAAKQPEGASMDLLGRLHTLFWSPSRKAEIWRSVTVRLNGEIIYKTWGYSAVLLVRWICILIALLTLAHVGTADQKIVDVLRSVWLAP